MGSPPPPFKVYKLCELLDTYHEDFPVLATLVHYKDMPVEFTHCLSPGCELIVHNIERQDRLLAKAGHKYFSIARNMPGKFRKTLRKFRSIADMKYMFPDPLQEDVCVKILQEVASDSPVQFSLATGDVVKFKTFQAKTHKVKLKSKTYSECSVIHCEKRRENGKFEKILLPDDLDILVHELPSPSKVDGFCIDEVFRYRPELPFSVDFLADYNSMWGCLPVSSEIMFTNFVTEPLAVISQLSKADEDSDTRRHIDNRVRDCLLVPARHFMMLTVKERLGFPSNYFMFPDKNVFIGCAVEKIRQVVFCINRNINILV
ncbi:hypothetical protein DPMN_084081 [Dreissena polymorpha]|uniref:CABIT domain-containing protein n=1 Tax=Dreissena polymorpha TaxID=45954 RepID=A0A9D3YAG2_DREPO|nr:hypothetical protein DPMN_084081 [Dreissena polymorpha]